MKREPAHPIETEIPAAAGCYRVATQPAGGRADERAASANAAAGAPVRARSAPAPSVARAPAAAAENFAATQALTLRLDTLRRANLYVVRAAESDSVIGSWTRLGDDSVRVDLTARGRLILVGKDRVACRE